MKKFFLYFLILVVLSGIVAIYSAPVLVAADSKFIQGLNQTADKDKGAGYETTKTPLVSLFKSVGLIFTTVFLGVSFLGLMIYAGIVWMMARGNAQEVERAKNIIIYAVMGMAVVLGAFVITLLVVPLWGYVTTLSE